MIQAPLLEVEGLSIAYSKAPAVHELSLTINRREAFGLVGESGSGKSTVALALMRYLPQSGQLTGGRITFDGQDVMRLDATDLRRFRGRRAAMVYQNPGSALDPSMIVGRQVAEVFTAHHATSASEADRLTIELLHQVQLADPASIYHRYPHQLSGGMQQRVVIAMALAARPDLLILDEPTTGLDATVEAAILQLINSLRRELELTVLLISHNLSVIRRVCDRVGVLYAGRLVEQGPVPEIFVTPAHPYTRGLLASLPTLTSQKRTTRLQPIPGRPVSAATQMPGCTFAPRCTFARENCAQAEPALLPVPSGSESRVSRCYYWDEVLATPTDRPPLTTTRPAGDARTPTADTVLSAIDTRKVYRVPGGTVVALDGINLELQAGQTLGLVGESGSGKSTLARVVAGLDPLDSGGLAWRGAPLDRTVQKRPRSVLRQLQMVFQDPDSTLNPRHTVRTLLERSIRRLTDLDKSARQARAVELLTAVDMEAIYLDALPSELSGGQRQRVAIARAFAGTSALVLCDEPTSALDASVQATILNLLEQLQRDRGVAYLFISHDLTVVHYLADVVGVLYLGHLMELGSEQRVFSPPHHPYTEVLLASSGGHPRVNPDTATGVDRFTGRGCPFQASCPRKLGSICDDETPPWRPTGDGGGILCHIPLPNLTAAQHTVM